MDSGGEGVSEEMERHQDEEDETGSEMEGSEVEGSSSSSGEGDDESGSEESGEEEEGSEEGEEVDEDGESEEGADGEDWETSSETSSDSEEESSSNEEDEINKPGTSKKRDDSPKVVGTSGSLGGTVPNLDDISDLSDGETERCPICLSRFTSQSIGMPESCDHAFCIDCITEWSKNVNTCPKDRQVFNLILVRHDLDGPIVKRIKVADKHQQVDIPEEEEDTTCCEVCGRSDREDRLLLCDGCDLAYHCECLDPPLRRVPSEEWFCPDCTSFGVADSIQTTSPSITPRRIRNTSESRVMPHRRQIPRTLVAERVRNAIAELRSVRGRRRIVSDSDESEPEAATMESESSVAVVEPSTVAPRPRSTSTRKKTVKRKTRKRKKRKTTKRKTTKKKTTRKTKTTSSTSTTGKKKTTKTKRKTKRKTRRKKGKKRKVRTVRSTPKTPKIRIADALGIKVPAKGKTIPTMRSQSSFDRFRNEVGFGGLTILGDRDGLDPYFSDQSDNDNMAGESSGSTLIARTNVRLGQRSRASLKSHAVIGRRPAVTTSREVSSQAETPVIPFDLLGNILAGQDILHVNSEQVTIKRDGSLKINTPTSTSPSGIPAEKGGRWKKSTSRDSNSSNSPPVPTGRGNNNNSLDANRNSPGSSNNNNPLTGHSPPPPLSSADPPAPPLPNGIQQFGVGQQQQDGHPDMVAGGGSSGGGGGDSGGNHSDSDTSSNHGPNSGGDTQDRDGEEGNNHGNNDNSPSGDSNGADSDSVHNNSPQHNDHTGDDDNNAHSPSPNVEDSNQYESQGFDAQGSNNDSKNEDLYDPASPSDSQDGEMGADLNKSAEKEDKEKEEQEKDTEKEEYDPFAPTTSDQDEENSGDEREQNEESREPDEVSHGRQEEEQHEDEERREEEVDDIDDDHRLEINEEHDEEQEEREEEVNEDSYERQRSDEEHEEHHRRRHHEEEEEEEEEERHHHRRSSDVDEDNAELEHDLHAMLDDSDDDDMKMVPISELPRIPKRKRQETTENEVDVPTRSVLERASLPEKQDSFPRWEKRDRAYRERDRSDRDKGDREEKRRKHKEPVMEEEEVEAPRPRRRHKHRDHDRDRERERDKDKSDKHSNEWENIFDEIVPSTSSSSRHKHKKRSRSRSKERRRSRRSRSRSHERTKESRRRRGSRSRSEEGESNEKPSRRKRSRADRADRDTPERKQKNRRRSRSRSPHHRDRDHRDKEEREGERGRRSIADVFKGSVKMFSQSLKEASDVENTGRRFKLKRNFYQDNAEHSKKSRYEETESTYERRSERPEVKSAVVRPCAVQEMFDSDGEDCEIIGVEIKGVVHKDHKGVPPKKPERKGSRNPPRQPITIDLVGAESPPKEPAPKPTNKSPKPTQPVPTHPTPQKPESKVTFKLPDKKAKSTNLVAAKINIFESDDDEEEEDYDPFEPTDACSPQSRPKEPPSPKDKSSDSSSDDSDNEEESREDSRDSRKKDSPSISPPPRKEKDRRSPPHSSEDKSNKKKDEPKPPKTPPLPAAPPPAEPKTVAKAPAPRGAPPLEAPHADQPGSNPQNMVLQQIGSLPLLQGLPPPGNRPVLMNHMLVNGPPPPHPFPHVQSFPPGRLWAPNVIMRSRLHPSLAQNGGPPEHMRFDRPPPPIPGMRPGMPPPPPPGAPPLTDKVDLATPPPPLPTKALEEMEQISQLLNARVGQPGGQQAQQQSSSGSRKDSALFKVPMPPPPLPGNKENSKNSSDLDMEVVDMDVASPLSDDDNLLSFSPPPLDDDKPWDKKRDRGGPFDLGKDDDVPTSAVELDKRQKYMKKLNRQERVVEEVKLAIKPHYSRGKIDKDEYKEILRKAVPKICHSKSGDINSAKIRNLIAAYVDKVRKMRKYEARKQDTKIPPQQTQQSSSSAKANGQKRRK